MTLKQFKDTIQVGDNIIMTGFTKDGQDIQKDIMKKMRTVSYKDTTGFYLKGIDDTTGRGSFCQWPKASELQISGNVFVISDSFGERIYQIMK